MAEKNNKTKLVKRTGRVSFYGVPASDGAEQQNLPVWRSSRHFQSPRTRPPMNASTWTRIPATAT